MGLTFEPLGKYVRLVDERNTDMVTESVLGINIDKYFSLTGVLLGPDCRHGLGAVQCAMRGHEKEDFTSTVLRHDIESYAVRIVYRERWRKNEGWQPYSSFVI